MISVIIPVYNSEETLTRCVNSLLSQTCSDIEILLVNDGSTDQSWDICKQIQKTDERVKTFKIVNNGPAFARNVGVDNSSGEYICFADADDTYEPAALETLLKSMTGSVDMAVCNFVKIIDGRRVNSGNENFIKQNSLMSRDELLAYTALFIDKPYLYTMLMHCWGVLYKTSIIKGKEVIFDRELHNLEDVDFNFKYLQHVNSLAYISVPLYNYSIQDERPSAGMKIGGDIDRFKQYKKAFETVAKYAKIEVGHGYVSYMIIMLMRASLQPGMYDFVKEVACDEYLREKLKYYHPSGRDSRLVPLLIWLKWIRLLIWVSRLKFKQHRRTRKKW